MISLSSRSSAHGAQPGARQHFLQHVARSYEARSRQLRQTVDVLGDALRLNRYQLSYYRKQIGQLTSGGELDVWHARHMLCRLSAQALELRGRYERAEQAERAALAMAERIRRSVDGIQSRRSHLSADCASAALPDQPPPFTEVAALAD